MIVFSNNNITEVHYSGYTIDKIYACDGELVYESINCSLPDVPFVLNYNAKQFNSATNTIPMTSGQTNGIDCVLSGSTSALTISNDHISWGNTSSIIAPIKGSADTNIDCCMTIVAKTKSSLGDRRKVSFMRTINRSGDLDDGFRNWDLLYTNFYGSNSIHFERDYWTNQMATMYSNGISASTTEPNIMSFEIHYCTTSNAVLKNHTDGQNVVDNNFDIGATTPDGNTATLFNDDWFGDFYWVYLSMGELTEEQIQQVICYNERMSNPPKLSAVYNGEEYRLEYDGSPILTKNEVKSFLERFPSNAGIVMKVGNSVNELGESCFALTYTESAKIQELRIGSSVKKINTKSLYFSTLSTSVSGTTFESLNNVVIDGQNFEGSKFQPTLDFSNCSFVDNRLYFNIYTSNGITDVIIPSSITSMTYSIYDCSDLKTVTMLPTTPPAMNTSNCFYKVKNLTKIYVPVNSLNAYKSASGWSTLSSKIYPIPTK